MKAQLRNGQTVTCSACQKRAVVKVFTKKQVTIIGPDAIQSFERQNIALQCQDCGSLICFSCASSTTGTVGVPRCPKCNKEGGPYFILGEEQKPWWKFWK